MRVILEMMDGPLAGRRIELNTGQSVSVGRTAKSQLMLPHDNFLSGMHFSVEVEQDRCVVKDHNSSNGTYVNGVKITEVAARDGDQITAGQTRMLVRSEAEASTKGDWGRTTTVMYTSQFQAPAAGAAAPAAAPEPPPGPELSPEQQLVVEYLKHQTVPLYAILDAATEPRVPRLLSESGLYFLSLYEGPQARDMAATAPYLVTLPTTSAFLPWLVKESWGKHWGMFLTCGYPMDEIRKHLRRFLIVQTEDGKKFFFRFYDPRILQYFLPSCTPEEVQQFFGPLMGFVIEEAENPASLLDFTFGAQGVIRKQVPLRK